MTIRSTALLYVSLFLSVGLVSICLPAHASSAAVILQYHHVSSSTPPSTSVTPIQFKQHVDWLISNGFEVLPLPRVIQNLKTGQKFKGDKIASITFDDANISVCTEAWPILKEYELPFTLFISTEMVEKKYQSHCSWSILAEMMKSGLMTPANHSHTHPNMISHQVFRDGDNKTWQDFIRQEINTAQNLIKERLGVSTRLFAYPYGEYNDALEAIISDLGFVGFGQNSGAIGTNSYFSALSRFPISANHASINTLKDKLLSLPFPARFKPNQQNPINPEGPHNPPTLRLIPYPGQEAVLLKAQCFNSYGKLLPTTIRKGELIVKANSKLEPGRQKYTCTSQSDQNGRFYWGSYQWLIE